MTVCFPKGRPERARKGGGVGGGCGERRRQRQREREIETEICLVARRAYMLRPHHSVPESQAGLIAQ